jgi:hypothetical protein
MNTQKPKEQPVAAAKQPYIKPRINRWGTLRDLTQGGGGRKNEPVTKRKTRF